MKGVFKENKDLVFLKEEFSTFVKKKKQSPTEKSEKVNAIPQKETLVLEEAQL
ncbi:hypothetical protein [Flavobacterium sp.]|uniref:hypothetical protein n=1 Tax=Flavobacterium sp. TaxID=239 RepID=UPI002FDB8B3F